MKLSDLCTLLDTAWPPHLAESWDNVGLLAGDPASEVTTVAVALEANDTTVTAAIDAGAQLLITHHPLIFKGEKTVAATTPTGRLLHRLITSGCALFAAHTNADAAVGGVNDVLAELLGVTNTRPLAPSMSQRLDKWGVTVDPAHVADVKAALFGAGAGRLGHYTDCSFDIQGQGSFTPDADATPALGTLGHPQRVDEVRIECVAPTALRARIYQALLDAHPYEQPACDVVAMEIPDTMGKQGVGIGRVGELEEPMTLREFTQRVADRLPRTVWGVRAAGDPDAVVSRVAVCSGAGDSFLQTAARCGADVYVTSDLRHHPADGNLRAGGPAVVDTAHWASEFPWCYSVKDLLAGHGVEAVVIEESSDPWTISAHPSGDGGQQR